VSIGNNASCNFLIGNIEQKSKSQVIVSSRDIMKKTVGPVHRIFYPKHCFWPLIQRLILQTFYRFSQE